MKKNISPVLILLALALVLCGCPKRKPGAPEAGAPGGKPAQHAAQTAKSEPSGPRRFGTLAADLCAPDRIPDLMVQSVEFITRLRSTSLMLDLQDKTMDQALDEARAEMESLTGDMKADFEAHPIETCEVMEEPVPCKTAAADLATGGGSLFAEDAVMDVFKTMKVVSCGYLTASFKLKGREPQSQKFLAGKSGGQWRLITEMPEMR